MPLEIYNRNKELYGYYQYYYSIYAFKISYSDNYAQGDFWVDYTTNYLYVPFTSITNVKMTINGKTPSGINVTNPPQKNRYISINIAGYTQFSGKVTLSFNYQSTIL